MSLDATFSGPPSANSPGANSQSTAIGLDKASAALYVNVGQGWQPVGAFEAKVQQLNVTTAQASFLVYTAPITAVYNITVIAAQATGTGGTLPLSSVTFTDAFTGLVVSNQPIVSIGTVTTTQGQSQSGLTNINVLAGTTVTVSTAVPTTLTANIKAGINLLG